MNDPVDVAKHEPRKSLLILTLMSSGGLVLGTIILIAGFILNADIAKQVAGVFLAIGALGWMLYVKARRNPTRLSSQRDQDL